MELGIYIHIPFCIKKCDYCDFISYPNCYKMQDKYIENLLEEIEENKELLQKNFVSTIYIGGGTPSSIKPELIKKILDKIYNIIGYKVNINANNCNKKNNNISNINAKNGDKKNNDTSNINAKNGEEELNTDLKTNPNIEITIEVNPGTTTKNNLQLYKKYGINRLSIGLQSTNDKILKEIGRIHNYLQFVDTYKWAVEAGFKNINVDLMLGLPNQSIEDLKDSLEKITSLEPVPKHISVYSLIVEEGTKIEQNINSGKLKLPDDEEERLQYHYTKNYLELNGYKHYEISNFAKPGFESKHNVNCWEQKQYVGFGVAAHSYIDGVRYSNTNDLQEYLKIIAIKNTDDKKIKNLENKNNQVLNHPFKGKQIIEEVQDKIEMEKEFMMLGFRMLDGVKISKFKEKFGENPLYLFRNEINKLVEEKLIEVDLDNIKLTSTGLDLANLVFEEFI